MSTSNPPRTTSAAGGREKSYFEQQRELLIGEIAMSFEHVLANINKLNRNLEAVNTVGNEFSSVEALWSQFENVMAKDNNNNNNNNSGAGATGAAGAKGKDDGDHHGDMREDDGEENTEMQDTP